MMMAAACPNNNAVVWSYSTTCSPALTPRASWTDRLKLVGPRRRHIVLDLRRSQHARQANIRPHASNTAERFSAARRSLGYLAVQYHYGMACTGPGQLRGH